MFEQLPFIRREFPLKQKRPTLVSTSESAVTSLHSLGGDCRGASFTLQRRVSRSKTLAFQLPARRGAGPLDAERHHQGSPHGFLRGPETSVLCIREPAGANDPRPHMGALTPR